MLCGSGRGGCSTPKRAEIGSKGGAAILLHDDPFDGRPAKVIGPVLHFLFSAGQRPSRDALMRIITPSPRFRIGDSQKSTSGGGNDESRLEVVVDGLSFDILGLEPGGTAVRPDIRHYADGAIELTDGEVEVVALIPGPHIASGPAELPIIRAMMELAVGLTTAWTRSIAVVWGPGRIAATPGFFSRAVARWIGDGPFPASTLVGFARHGEETLRSEGAAFFVGQEIEVTGEVARATDMARGIGSRVMNHLMTNGRIEEVSHIQGRDGTVLRLAPAGTDGQWLRVSNA